MTSYETRSEPRNSENQRGDMRIPPERSSVNIVLIGSLNPAIFHPAWFGANGLLSHDDVNNAEVELIHREVAAFKVGGWLRVRVERTRFFAETSEPPYVRLSDLVARTFGEALSQTPISKMGINRQVHFSVGDEATRNRIGRMLAPPDAWGEWAPSIMAERNGKHGGMTSLTMSQEALEDREIGFIRAKIEPSVAIQDKMGIFMEVNDHYEIPEDRSSSGATCMTDILLKHFDTSIRRSEWIIDQVMALKEKV